MINREQALHAMETQEDVYTAEGDAVTVNRVGTNVALVYGELHHEEWIPLHGLWLSRRSEAPGERDTHPFDL